MKDIVSAEYIILAKRFFLKCSTRKGNMSCQKGAVRRTAILPHKTFHIHHLTSSTQPYLPKFFIILSTNSNAAGQITVFLIIK